MSNVRPYINKSWSVKERATYLHDHDKLQHNSMERDSDSHAAAIKGKRPFVWIDILINRHHHALKPPKFRSPLCRISYNCSLKCRIMIVIYTRILLPAVIIYVNLCPYKMTD
jgi:hypothetical protein